MTKFASLTLLTWSSWIIHCTSMEPKFTEWWQDSLPEFSRLDLWLRSIEIGKQSSLRAKLETLKLVQRVRRSLSKKSLKSSSSRKWISSLSMLKHQLHLKYSVFLQLTYPIWLLKAESCSQVLLNYYLTLILIWATSKKTLMLQWHLID